jgi:Glycosyltransferase family 87
MGERDGSTPANSKAWQPLSGVVNRWWLPAAVALGCYLPAIGLMVGVLVFSDAWYGFFDMSDIPVYFDFASSIDKGLRPFVDFPVEYPPLAIRFFALPGHPTALDSYVPWFALIMLAALAVASVFVTQAALLLRGSWRQAAGAGATFAASVLALGAIVANRFDALVALSVAGFLWAAMSRRWVLAGLLLGVGTALKFTPIILLPILLLLASDAGSRVKAALAFSAFAVLPFLLEAPAAWEGIMGIFRFHGLRPLQAESVLATPLLLAHVLGLQAARTGSAFGSQFISAPGAPVLAGLSGLLAAGLLLLVYFVVWRRREALRSDPLSIPLASLATLLGFLVASKVLSPQYLTWLLPGVALLGGRRKGLAGLLMLVFLATQVEFPSLYWDFIDLGTVPVLIVVGRNLALVAAFGWSLSLLVRHSPRPAEPAPGVGNHW